MELQSWKLNFRTEVCMRTAEPQVTMRWIKEVEVAKSIDELVTSRSITGQHNFLAIHASGALIRNKMCRRNTVKEVQHQGLYDDAVKATVNFDVRSGRSLVSALSARRSWRISR